MWNGPIIIIILHSVELSTWLVLTVSVQADLIEVSATRLMSDVLVDNLRPKLIEADGIGEGLTARLQGEGDIYIPLHCQCY